MILIVFVLIGGISFIAHRQTVAERTQREFILSLMANRGNPLPPTVPPPLQIPSTLPGSAGGSMPSTGMTEPAMAATDFKTMTFDGLSVSHPSAWKAVTYQDEFFGGQTNLRLTSQPGELRIGGGPGMEGVTYFDQGYQLDLRKLHPEQFLGSTGDTANPLVKRVYEGCADAGCPAASYLVEKGGKRYALDVYYFVANDEQPSAMSTVERIVASIK